MKKLIFAWLRLSCCPAALAFLRDSNPYAGTAMIGGQENTVQIYGVRKQNNQTQYRAGYPFNWNWMSANTFTSTTCK
jgi:hypothetical protein